MTPILLIATSAALAVVLVALALYSYSTTAIDERRELRRRLTANPTEAPTGGRAPTEILRSEGLSSSEVLNALLRRFSLTAYLERQLLQAGMQLSVGNLLYMQGAVASAAALAVQIVCKTPFWVGSLAGIAAGIVVPLLFVHRKRNKRLALFASQFPGTLAMIQSSIHAGHSLNYALEVAVEELPEPTARELRIVLEEMRLGLSPKAALENLCRRIPIGELRFFMLAVVLTREVGGNLSEVLGTLATTLRERMKLRQTVRALTAQGRASAILLCALPPGVGLMANVVSPGFLAPLWSTPAGRICLGVAVGFEVLGLLLARRVVNPKELAVA
jgi:tight adherence protein B